MRVGVVGPLSLDLLRWTSGPPPDLPVGSTAPVVTTLANGLLERGHDVTVFTLSPQVAAPTTHTSGPLTVCIAPQRVRHRGRDFFARERRLLLAMLREHECDVLHAQWTYEYALAALATGRPALITAHDHAATIIRHVPDLHRAARLLMDRTVVRRAPRLTATSAYLLARLAPSVRGKTTVIPNLIPRSMFEQGAAEDDRRRPDGPPVIVTVVNGFDRRKNVDGALEAFALLRARHPQACLRLVGLGMGPGQVAQKHALRRGVAEGVDFLGAQPFATALGEIAGADVLLHPSREEAFGMTVLEAMALGTPVVAGLRSGNVPHLLAGGRCGVLCDVEDPVDVAAAVCATLEEAKATSALIGRARRQAQTGYCEDVVVPRYEEAYRRVVAEWAGERG